MTVPIVPPRSSQLNYAVLRGTIILEGTVPLHRPLAAGDGQGTVDVW
jgi:hypothetical protein